MIWRAHEKRTLYDYKAISPTTWTFIRIHTRIYESWFLVIYIKKWAFFRFSTTYSKLIYVNNLYVYKLIMRDDKIIYIAKHNFYDNITQNRNFSCYIKYTNFYYNMRITLWIKVLWIGFMIIESCVNNPI